MCDFQVGDHVEWTHVSGGRHSFTMQSVKGYIHEIQDEKARCRRGKNGKKDYWVHLSVLGKPGDRKGTKPIRDFVSMMVKGHQEREQES